MAAAPVTALSIVYSQIAEDPAPSLAAVDKFTYSHLAILGCLCRDAAGVTHSGVCERAEQEPDSGAGGLAV